MVYRMTELLLANKIRSEIRSENRYDPLYSWDSWSTEYTQWVYRVYKAYETLPSTKYQERSSWEEGTAKYKPSKNRFRVEPPNMKRWVCPFGTPSGFILEIQSLDSEWFRVNSGSPKGSSERFQQNGYLKFRFWSSEPFWNVSTTGRAHNSTQSILKNFRQHINWALKSVERVLCDRHRMFDNF